MSQECDQGETDVYSHLKETIEADVFADETPDDSESWTVVLSDDNLRFAREIQTELGLSKADTIRTIVLLGRANLSMSTSASDRSLDDVAEMLDDIHHRLERIEKVAGVPEPLTPITDESADSSSQSRQSSPEDDLGDHL